MSIYRTKLEQIKTDGAPFKVLLPSGATAKVTIAQLEEDFATLTGTLDDAMAGETFRLIMHISQVVIVA